MEKIHLARLSISGCLGCGGCDKTGQCVQKDDMQSVYAAMEQSTHIAVASPIYFYNITSYTKAMIDRIQAFWCRKYLLKEAARRPQAEVKQRGFFLSAAATDGKRAARTRRCRDLGQAGHRGVRWSVRYR